MPIAKWSDINRFPRKGMIRLGIKVKKENGTEYPTKTDYFVCPPEVQAIYGEKPVHLDIVIPIEGDIDDVFPQWYKLYGRSGLKGKSDGIHKWTRPANPDDEWVKSPTNEQELKQLGYKESATLTFILPKVTLSGSYQIVTGSFQSIVNINAMIRMIRGWIGRISGIPLHLHLEPQNVSFQEGEVLKKTTIYSLKLEFNPEEIKNYIAGKAAAYQIEGPKLAMPAGQMTEEPTEEPSDTPAAAPDAEEPPMDIDHDNPMANFESFNEAIDPGSDPGITTPEQAAISFGDVQDQGDTASSVGHATAAAAEVIATAPSAGRIMDPTKCPNKADHTLLAEQCSQCTYNPGYARARVGNIGVGLAAKELGEKIKASKDEAELDTHFQSISQHKFTKFEEAMLKGMVNKKSEELLLKK